MVFIGLLLIFGVIIAFEVPELVKKELWRELVVFSAILIIGMFYSFTVVLDINILNPTKPIKYIFDPPYKVIENLLK